ncbi:MAG: hypothetical protein OXC42_07680 [Gammaproteobacteria bacterium]|nr:hypothetical protein [Gammaproteobacteria bacterium]
MVFHTRGLRYPSPPVRGPLRDVCAFLALIFLLGACAGGGGSGSSSSLPDAASTTPASQTGNSQTGTTGTSTSFPVQNTQTSYASIDSSTRQPRILLHKARYNPLVVLTWGWPRLVDRDSILRYEYRMDEGSWEILPGMRRNLVVDDLADGQAYTFQVRAIIDGADPVVSNEVRAHDHPPSIYNPQPDQVLNLQARGGDGSIFLSWRPPVPTFYHEDPTARESIQFYLYRQSGGDWKKTDTSTAHIVEGLENDRAYTFSVRAISNHGIGEEASVTASTSSAAQLPDAPTGLVARFSSPWTDLSWNAPLWDGGEAITSYQYQVNDGTWQDIDTNELSTTSCPYWCVYGAALNTLAGGDRIRVRARNQDGAGVGSNEARVSALPVLSVSDASAREGVNETMVFVVKLNRRSSASVSVSVATSNGSAHSGSDYSPVNTTLTFDAGQTSKSVAVTVLDDEIDEAAETFTLTLSNPSGALILDGEGTGTIVNTDVLPRAWVTRFGRMVGQQAMDAIDARIGAGPANQVVVGGRVLDASKSQEALQRDEPAGFDTGSYDPGWSAGELAGKNIGAHALKHASAFQFSEAIEGSPSQWTVWGRLATGGFEAEDGGVDLDGEVSSGFLGADITHGDWLGGVALGVSEGEGDFERGAGTDKGRLESRLASIYPYARYALGERIDIWGMVGYGSGEMELTTNEKIDTDLEMRMGALGVRAELASENLDLALKSDVMWVQTESDARRTSHGGWLEGARGEVSRIRLQLAGARTFRLESGAFMIPSMEFGVRHDGGDAETGTGLEAEAGMQFITDSLSLRAGVHGLLAHEESDYEEWGVSGSIQKTPDSSGRGLSLSAASTWGLTLDQDERLWSAQDAAGVLDQDTLGAPGRSRPSSAMAWGYAGTGVFWCRMPGTSFRAPGTAATVWVGDGISIQASSWTLKAGAARMPGRMDRNTPSSCPPICSGRPVSIRVHTRASVHVYTQLVAHLATGRPLNKKGFT